MLNVVILMGRLVADPELRHTASDIPVTTIRIAVDRRYSRKDGEKETDFIDVTAWRHTAEFVCRYFRRGSMIAVQGSIRVENYTDRDGNKRTRVGVLADNVSFCGGKRETNPNGGEDTYGYQNSYSSQTSVAPAPTVPATEATTPVYVSGNADDFQTLPDDDYLPF